MIILMSKENKYHNLIVGLVVAIVVTLLLGTLYFFVREALSIGDKITWDKTKTTEKLLAYNEIRSKTTPGRITEIRWLREDLAPNEKPFAHESTQGEIPHENSLPPVSLDSSTLYFFLGPDSKGNKLIAGDFTLQDRQWQQKLYSTEIKVETVTTLLPGGEWNFYFKATMVGDKNEGPEEYRGKEIEVKMLHSEAVVDLSKAPSINPKDKMNWWNPRFSIGAQVYMYGPLTTFGLAPEASVSFSGYGPTENDQKLRLFEVTLSGDRSYIGLGVSPISVRPINILPNTYIRPIQFGYRQSLDSFPDRNYYLGTGIAVGL